MGALSGWWSSLGRVLAGNGRGLSRGLESGLVLDALEHRLMLAGDLEVTPYTPTVSTPPAQIELAAPARVVVAGLDTSGVATAPPVVGLHGPDYTASVRADAAVLQSHAGDAGTLRVDMLGANVDAALLSAAQGEWLFDDVYAGIDLRWYRLDADGTVEYDWIVAPQADPDSIRMAFGGAFGIDIEADGDLALHTAAGDWVQQAPVIYQELDGQRQHVDGRFELLPRAADGSFVVGFDLGSYDPNRPLVIDPIIGYSTYVGGSGNEAISVAQTDAQGNVYVLGTTTSPDLGGSLVPDDRRQKAFWAKYDAQGRQQYMHVVGASSDPNLFAETQGVGLVLGSDGTPYVLLRSYEFPYDGNGLPSAPADVQLQLAALDAAGEAQEPLVLLRSDTTVPATTTSVYDLTANGMTLGPDGGLYVSAYTLAGLGTPAYHLIKVMPGAGIVFDQPLFDLPASVRVDAEQHIYLGFSTSRSDLPVSENAIRRKADGSSDLDIYLMALDATASGILWSTYLGGDGHDHLGAMTISPDRPGVMFLAGANRAGGFPAGGGFQDERSPDIPNRSNGYEGIVAVVDLPNMQLQASTYLGGGGDDMLGGIALDGLGNVYVSGQSNSPTSRSRTRCSPPTPPATRSRATSTPTTSSWPSSIRRCRRCRSPRTSAAPGTTARRRSRSASGVAPGCGSMRPAPSMCTARRRQSTSPR